MSLKAIIVICAVASNGCAVPATERDCLAKEVKKTFSVDIDFSDTSKAQEKLMELYKDMSIDHLYTVLSDTAMMDGNDQLGKILMSEDGTRTLSYTVRCRDWRPNVSQTVLITFYFQLNGGMEKVLCTLFTLVNEEEL